MASSDTSKHPPFISSPSKPFQSPSKSPSKSLRDYFKSACASAVVDNRGLATSSSAAADSRPSCSAVRKLNESFLIDVPPASQLDHSVLDALPPLLQKKIMEGYSKREQTVAQVVPKNERIIVEEGKGWSRFSGGGNVERASPQEMITGVYEGGVEMIKEGGEGRKKARGKVKEAADEEVLIYDEDRFLNDWKKDICDWIYLFSDGPTDNDVLAVSGHFCKLVKTNLKMVEVCLKIFRRFLMSRGLNLWYPCFNFILEQSQERVKIAYGGTLKLLPLTLV